MDKAPELKKTSFHVFATTIHAIGVSSCSRLAFGLRTVVARLHTNRRLDATTSIGEEEETMKLIKVN